MLRSNSSIAVDHLRKNAGFGRAAAVMAADLRRTLDNVRRFAVLEHCDLASCSLKQKLQVERPARTSG